MSGYDKLVEQLNSLAGRSRMRRVVGWAIIFFVFAALFAATVVAEGWFSASLLWGSGLGLTALTLLGVHLIDG